MLRENAERYTKLTGESGWHAPILRVDAYLDGYNKGLEMLDKIRAEIEEKGFNSPLMNPVFTMTEIMDIIDKYRSESEDN